MQTNRLLLCRPMGGLNDVLTQVEVACRYAERFGRTVVVETKPPSGNSFRDRLSRYFISRQPMLVLDTDGLAAALDGLEVRPAFLSGRVNSYATRFSAEESNHVDTATGRKITFDFNVDHPEALLVHHCAGGGQIAIHALERLGLDLALGEALKARLAALGSSYLGVHVRNTDYQTRYDKPSLAQQLAGAEPIFLATDSRTVLERFRDIFGAERVRSFAALPDPAVGPLHRWAEAPDAYVLNRDAILDVLTLAFASRYVMFELQPNRFGARYSGYSLLAANLHNNQNLVRRLVEPFELP
jgi:hypothetical protein